MRWPWTKIHPETPLYDGVEERKAEAQEALQVSREELEKAKEKGKEVQQMVWWLKLQREENHFAPAIVKAITRERP